MLHRIFGLYIENILQSFFYFPCIVIWFFSLSDENGTKNFTVTTEILVQYNFYQSQPVTSAISVFLFWQLSGKGQYQLSLVQLLLFFTFKREWASLCCLTPTQQFISYIMGRTSQFSTNWWGSLCTRPTRQVGFW
jgi:hypothetical protein